MWKVKLRSWIRAPLRWWLRIPKAKKNNSWEGNLPTSVRIVPNAVPVEDSPQRIGARHPETCGAVANKEILFFAGRYCRCKERFESFRRANCSFFSERPAAVFVGSGPLEHELVESSEAPSLGRPGEDIGLYRATIRRWIKRARAFVTSVFLRAVPKDHGEDTPRQDCPLFCPI